MIADKLVRDPVYKQLNDALRGLIRSGEFARGQKFLSEREIGERFSVSRATANKALSTLVAEGVLLFRKGVGTFVRGDELRPARSFEEQALAVGRAPSTRVLVAELIGAAALDPAVAARLSLGPGEGAFYLERLRLVGDEPLLLERRYIAERRCPTLLENDLTGSLHVLFARRYGHGVVGSLQALRAIAAGAAEAEHLDVATGAPCLQVERITALVAGATLWWESALYRGDTCELRSHAFEWSMPEIAPVRESRPQRVQQA